MATAKHQSTTALADVLASHWPESHSLASPPAMAPVERDFADRARTPFVVEAIQERALDAFAAKVQQQAGPDAAMDRRNKPLGATNWSFLLVPLVFAGIASQVFDAILAFAFLLAPVVAIGFVLWDRYGPKPVQGKTRSGRTTT